MEKNLVYEKLNQCYESMKNKLPFKPQVALILGSGLGNYAERFQEEGVIDYREIEGFPVSTVPGHKGRFIFAHVEGTPVVMMQGRVHYYEGYPMSDVVLPVRLMRKMGAKVLFLTNAAGGVNFDFAPGDFMLIRDQIASFVPSPLLGLNVEEWGARFPDMSHIYDEDLQEIIRSSASQMGLKLQEGVYLQLTGPAYESPAEIRMCRALGADAVGMSTACEAVAANHMGYKICGISCISNLASGMTQKPLSHKEVQETADRMAVQFEELVTRSIGKMKE